MPPHSMFTHILAMTTYLRAAPGTPAHRPRARPKPGGHTVEVLIENGFTTAQVNALLKEGAAVDASTKARL
jgi:crotonobetainyl-CoA:carnitine CoA-transferase CaiB-like acyl-CoA transferase